MSTDGETGPIYVAKLTQRTYRAKAPVRITSPDDIEKLLRKKLLAEKREHFVVVLLNARHDVAGIETISIGSLNASIVHPREVFRPAVLNASASVVLVHNHPSGDPEPSEEDFTITRRLIEAGAILGIGVLDHVIIAARGTHSMRAKKEVVFS